MRTLRPGAERCIWRVSVGRTEDRTERNGATMSEKGKNSGDGIDLVESLGAAVAQSEPVDVNVAERQRAFEVLGAMKGVGLMADMGFAMRYQMLRQIRDDRLYRFIDSGKGKRTAPGAVFRPCQSFKEFLPTVGMSEGYFYEMEREIDNLGARTAQFLRDTKCHRDIRRRLLSAPEATKGELAKLAEEAAAGGHDGAVMERLDAILDALENSEEQQGRLAKLEEKVAKSDVDLERLGSENHDLKDKRGELEKSLQKAERDLALPRGLRDPDRHEQFGRLLMMKAVDILGHLEDWTGGLAEKLEKGHKDRAAIETVLSTYKVIVELFGKGLGDALVALDTGENAGEYIKFWAQNAIWSGNGEPGDEALLEGKS